MCSKVRTSSLRSKSDDPFLYVALIFHHRNGFSTGMSEYHSTEARRSIIAVNGGCDASRRLQYKQQESCAIYNHRLGTAQPVV